MRSSSRFSLGLVATSALVTPVLAQPDPAAPPVEEPAPAPEPAPEPEPAPPPPPPPPPPAASAAVAEPVAPTSSGVVLPNMLAHDRGGTIDARLEYTGGDFLADDVTLFAINLHGQYIGAGGLGGYVSLPMYYADGDNDSDSGAGNLEIGALYAMAQGPATSVLLRGGLSLDTAGEAEGFLAPFANIAPRLNDYATTGLDTTWLRAQASIRHDAGGVVIGATGGVDLPIEGAATEDTGFDGILNLAASIGVQQPGFGAGVGLVMLQVLGSEADDDNVLGMNASVDFPATPTTRVVVGLGLNLEEDIGDIWSFGVGARFAIR